MKNKTLIAFAISLIAVVSTVSAQQIVRPVPASSITSNRVTSIFVMPVPDLSAYPTTVSVLQAIAAAPVRSGPGSVMGMGDANRSTTGDAAWAWSGFAGVSEVLGFSYLCLANGPAFVQTGRSGEQYTAFLPNLNKPLGAGGFSGAGYYYPACPAGSSGYATTIRTFVGDQSPGEF